MTDPLLGQVIAQRYRLISVLGSGAMATVYLARHVLIERLCAIKVFRPDLGASAVLRERFLREARAVNRIHHPNIVEITDFGESDGLVYLVMEYVPGEALSRVLIRERLGWRAAAALGIEAAAALSRAHEMGVIHRDLKPGNLLVLPRKDGTLIVKITDFGVAKVMNEPKVTETSVFVGTPGYMAPEYLLFGRVEARSDLYSLGVVLFQAVTGEPPPTASLPNGRVTPEMVLEPLPSLRAFAPDIPQIFDDVIRTLAAPEPDDRPRDAQEALDLLLRALGDAEDPAVSNGDAEPGAAISEDAAPRGSWPHGARASDLPSNPIVSPRRAGPRIVTSAPSRIHPMCRAALEALRAATPPPSGPVKTALSHAEKQVDRVRRIAEMVAKDTEEDDSLRERARELHNQLGRSLDEKARERSRTLGWAGTVAERAERVRDRRSIGEDPISTMDVLVWEQAALEHEEEDARARAAEIAEEMRAIQAEIITRTEAIDQELATVTARLSGRVAALRALALETWMDLEQAAEIARVPKDVLLPAPPNLASTS